MGFLAIAQLAGCGGGSEAPTEPGDPESLTCSIPSAEIQDGGVAFNGIPALLDPVTVTAGGGGLGFLEPGTRVIGVTVGDRTIAVPFNILWWHEVANFDVGDRHIAVTYCPLTGSSLVFERGAVGNEPLFVSGLLWRNNLIMTTERPGGSLFVQMSREAKCGPARGTELETLPAAEMTWGAWRELHPGTEVVNAATGFDRDYTQYPYGSYRDLGNPLTLFPLSRLDGRRPPKERLLGIPDGSGGLAFPFLELERAGPVAVAAAVVAGEEVVVFWESEAEGAIAFRPVVTGAGPEQEGRRLTFEVRDGAIADVETQSSWRHDGVAVTRPLAGGRLLPVSEAYTAFWFAWAVFQPDTEIWTAPGD